ncbi:MAG: single-stranded-DNA-specific exonuclease RecJ [Candidatus Poribacteria bacterium]
MIEDRKKVWRIKEPDQKLSQNLAEQLKIPLLIAQLLVNRNITDEKSAYEFLYPDISHLHSPYKLKGIPEAVERIKKAISNKEKIIIYGDYDVDGITSVCLMFLCLNNLGADVNYYIPKRYEEGYGLNCESLSELKKNGCDLLLTVDCGISTVNEVNFANENGMDVIITDHHEPSKKIPPAFAVINPKLDDSGYPYSSLAGVGVAFKLAQALMEDYGVEEDSFIENNLDLVALGTIADMAPLTGENRPIAALGLKALNKLQRKGIRALCEIANVKQGAIDSYMVGFRLSPRINAAGRMDTTAYNAVKLLLTESDDEAIELAQKLDNSNKERQSYEKFIVESAKKQVQEQNLAREKAIILAGEGWHFGAVGIAASKIKDFFFRPTVLISIEGDMGRGSARSIPEFDIHDAVSKCSQLLDKFGGHKSAVGFSIPKDNIEKFRKDFLAIASNTISKDDLLAKIDIDAVVSLSDLSMDAVESLSLLEPYGQENPQPLIAIKGLSLKYPPGIMGKANEHLQVTVTDGKGVMRAVAFNMSKLERELSAEKVKVDIAGRPSINAWNDNKSVELKVEEFLIYHKSGEEEYVVASDEIVEPMQIKIIDRRNLPDKKQYLKKLITVKEKSLMYVRDDSAVDQLHKIISSSTLKDKFGLCYSTTSADEADSMKSMLIADELLAIVSSIPFEEPLEGLKHLVFCHPVPTKDIFISSCSPALESQDAVNIHLIFNNNDIELLTSQLKKQYPDRNLLTNVYKKIRDLHKEKNSDPVLIEEIISGMILDEPKDYVLSRCIDIFEELNLIKRNQIDGKTTVLIPPESPKHRDLYDSKLYSSGDRIKNEWANFSRIILSKTDEEVRRMILEYF